MFTYKSEQYYINKINYILRRNWQMNMSEVQSVRKVKRYLKFCRVNSYDHPFIYDFKNKLNKVNFYSVTCSYEIDILLTEFYDYRKK